jgi:hypothetical protein
MEPTGNKPVEPFADIELSAVEQPFLEQLFVEARRESIPLHHMKFQIN